MTGIDLPMAEKPDEFCETRCQERLFTAGYCPNQVLDSGATTEMFDAANGFLEMCVERVKAGDAPLDVRVELINHTEPAPQRG